MSSYDIDSVQLFQRMVADTTTPAPPLFRTPSKFTRWSAKSPLGNSGSEAGSDVVSLVAKKIEKGIPERKSLTGALRLSCLRN